MSDPEAPLPPGAPAAAPELSEYERAMADFDEMVAAHAKATGRPAIIEKPTEEEWRETRELSEEIVARENSPWQPQCIADAFACDLNAPAPRFVLTLQRWINLERVRSPVLNGIYPPEIEDLEKALRAFDYAGESELLIKEWVQLAGEMVEACKRGFSTMLGMKPKDSQATNERDGFGGWAPMFACLVTQAGLTPSTALCMPVEQANILIAAMRRNQGWVEVGEPYNLRGMLKSEDAKGEPGEEESE